MLARKIFIPLLFTLLVISGGCKKDSIDNTIPVLLLNPDNLTGKAGRIVEATLSITAPNGAKDVVVYKTVNLVKDNTYGVSGTVTAVPRSVGDNKFEYHFEYELKGEEVEKLVGFNFKFTDAKGIAVEKDLTVNTTTSGQQIIYSRKWKLISKLWTSVSPAIEDLQDCAKDDIYKWNKDSTYNVNFGAKGCTFDGFNVFVKWHLSEDEKTFTQVYSSLFDPTNITTEVYRVKTLTKDKLVMEIFVDLSVFGPPYTDKEVFTYTFEPVP